jgi:Tfp pilus assembly protein PilF
MRTKSTLLILLASLAAGCGDTPQMTPKEQALQNWNAARAGVTMNLAKDEYKNGDFEKARRDVDQALLMDPKNTNIHILSAKIAIEQNQLELADAELNAARAINPKLPEADYLSGVIYQRWEQPAKALIFYQHASEENPTELSYLMAKAETLVSLNRRDEALDLLQNKADYFEHNPVIHDAMGMICMQDRNFDKAVDMFRWAVILAPDDDNIREHLSLALYQDKRYGESAMNLQRLVKTDARSKRPDLFLALAECDLNTNHPAEARMAAQTACDLDPSQPIPWLTVA